MNPAPSGAAKPSDVSPSPFMWEWGAILEERALDVADGGGSAL